MRAPALVAALVLAGCAGPQGDGLKVGVSLPTKVQAGVAGGSGEAVRPVGRVTGWEPYYLNGDENDRSF